MGKRRELKGKPEISDGLTMRDLAHHLSDRLGTDVTPQDVYAAAIKPDLVPVGRAERLIAQQPRLEVVLVVAPRYAGDVERAVRAALLKKRAHVLDEGDLSG